MAGYPFFTAYKTEFFGSRGFDINLTHQTTQICGQIQPHCLNMWRHFWRFSRKRNVGIA
jgi:hypothetical protein